MTALKIASTEDLLRALDQDPEFRSQARGQLLTEELLQLPGRFAQFAEHQEAFNEAQKITDQGFESALKSLFEVTQRNSDNIERLIEATQRNSDYIERLAEATQRNSDNIDKLARDVTRINNSIGELKGNVARRALNWHFGYIAEDMGYRLVNTVTRNKRWEMAHRQDISDIPVGQRRSFYEADLVMEVADTDGATHYIAVEASYTADTRDTERAMRNAEFLTRFTGCPAYAAVASRQNDYTIRQLIEDKVLFWYQLTDEDFTPD